MRRRREEAAVFRKGNLRYRRWERIPPFAYRRLICRTIVNREDVGDLRQERLESSHAALNARLRRYGNNIGNRLLKNLLRHRLQESVQSRGVCGIPGNLRGIRTFPYGRRPHVGRISAGRRFPYVLNVLTALPHYFGFRIERSKRLDPSRIRDTVHLAHGKSVLKIQNILWCEKNVFARHIRPLFHHPPFDPQVDGDVRLTRDVCYASSGIAVHIRLARGG